MNIYEKTQTNYLDNNGLGFLTDVINSKVIEKLNDTYTLELEYPKDGHLSEYLVLDNIIKCKVEDGTEQLFRIKTIKKNFDTIKLTAYHIFYDLLDNFLEDVYPQNLNAQNFLNHLLSHTKFSNSFIGHSDINDVKTARYVRKNPIAAIIGDVDNSMYNLFGGELKRDNYDIYFNSRIGNDNGVKLILGKNIKGIDVSIDITQLATRVMPQGYDGLLLPEKYIDSPLINNYPTPKITKIEFSDVRYDPDETVEGAYHNINEAYAELRRLVQEQFDNGLDKPAINIKINWIELSKTNEYKEYSNLETVRLGDTLSVNILGLDFETRVIKIEYNVLTNNIDKFEIGTFRPSLENTINKMNDSINQIQPSSIINEATDKATKLITNAMGGYVYKTRNELYIMDTNNPTTAQKVWRWNINGLGYSNTGVNGPYGLAMTMDGSIVADFITTGTIRANIVEGLENLTLQVNNNTSRFDDVYDKEQVDTLLISAASGLTNTFSEAGGNNLFRNTGLWFSQSDLNNPYEFWDGTVEKLREEKAASTYALLLKNTTLSQNAIVPNGNYTISFKYKKLIPYAVVKCVINDNEYVLTETTDTDFLENIVVTTQNIKISFISDTDSACEIYDLMVNAGTVKLAYSQNQNETTTETVNISKGITIYSSSEDTVFKANADGVRIYSKDDLINPKTKFTDKGTETDYIKVNDHAEIVEILIQKVGNNTWLSKI